MTRRAPALLALSIIAVAGWTYNVNYDTRAALDRLSGLRAEIAEQREALQVLRVEWAYLNAPDRLAELVALHNDALGLLPLVPEALGVAATIPYPPRDTPGASPAVPPEALIAAAPAAPAPAVGDVAEAMTLAALSGPAASATIVPAVLKASFAPASLPASDPPAAAETVPAALEAAIAAALAEAGVPVGEQRLASPRGGVITVPADRPAGDFAASGVPLPAARPVAWSGR